MLHMSITQCGKDRHQPGRLAPLPPHAPGARIGLFGGTFDPAHDGHFFASLIALRRLGLDRVWWIVTPGNPLKEADGLTPLAERVAAARAIARDRRIAVVDFEAAIGARYTFEALHYLRRRCPGARFVWIMGADNLASFHRWRRWREIAESIAIAVVDRPGSTLKAARSPAGHWLAPYRISEAQASLLPSLKPPAYIFLHGPRCSLSSTALRAERSNQSPSAASSSA
jgi:nicotinate-nucleotide adenylyltransferase